MGRRAKNVNATIDPETDSCVEPALDIKPNAVYLPSQIRTALHLRASSLRTEWRRGRLRIIRRCGRNYLLGRDVLEWLAGGELPSPAKRRSSSDSSLPGVDEYHKM